MRRRESSLLFLAARNVSKKHAANIFKSKTLMANRTTSSFYSNHGGNHLKQNGILNWKKYAVSSGANCNEAMKQQDFQKFLRGITATIHSSRSYSSEVTSEEKQNSERKSSWSWRRIGKVVIFSSAVLGLVIWYFGRDDDSNTNATPFKANGERKPRVVVLGSGWGALSFVQSIDTNEFDVVVVSPRNYFLFTPLLPSVTVGTLEAKSIIEPIRAYCKRSNAATQYYEAACIDVHPERNAIVCQDVKSDNKSKIDTFELSYDHLVVAVGAVNNTFGTPGVEQYCHFMREVEDALGVRKNIIDRFEQANMPGQSEEEKKKLLSFVIVGGGPNGVEIAAEMNDYFREDLYKWYPHLVKYINISLVELTDHILNFYDKTISEYAEKKFKRDQINLLVNSRVVEVKKDGIIIQPMKNREPFGDPIDVPYGICVWSTGVGMHPLAKLLKKKFSKSQTNNRGLVTDRFLTLEGSNNIYAIGDVATINQEKMLEKFVDLFREYDADKDGYLSIDEFSDMVKKEVRKYPQLDEYARRADLLFHQTDVNKDNKVSEEELRDMLKILDSKLKFLPATAQVAAQEGTYLAHRLSNEKKTEVDPFRYQHFGSFAYVGGDRAVAEFPSRIVLSGYGAWWLWRSVYWGKQYSLKNRVMVFSDWANMEIFGRSITRY